MLFQQHNQKGTERCQRAQHLTLPIPLLTSEMARSFNRVEVPHVSLLERIIHHGDQMPNQCIKPDQKNQINGVSGKSIQGFK